MTDQGRTPQPCGHRFEPPPDQGRRPSTFCFSIQASADSGTLARVLEQFAKRGLVPTKWYSDVCAESGRLQIDIQVARLAAGDGEFIATGLRSIVGVDHVLTGAKASVA
jgi:hypothetical protein